MNEITKELLDALKSVLFVCDYRKPTGVQTSNAEFLAHAAIAKAEAALAATQFDDGWIPWAGGDCPVAHSTIVDVRLRLGCEGRAVASNWRWCHETRGNPILEGNDIIAYRVVKP